MLELITAHFWVYLTLVGLLSLSVGSFINVVIHRLPMMLEDDWRQQCSETLNVSPPPDVPKFNLAQPASHCPQCFVKIRFWQNIPVISYIILCGQCSNCKTRIPIRYLLVETLCLLFSMIAAIQFGLSFELLAVLILTWLLLAMTFIDFKHQILPDVLTLPLLWLGLLVSCFNLFTTSHDAILGAIFGYAFFWIVNQTFKLFTKKDGIGQGDFKLLAAAGAWLGWQLLPFIILTSSILALVFGISVITFKKQSRKIPIPFGPFIAIALWLGVIWGFDLTQSYLHLFGISWSNV